MTNKKRFLWIPLAAVFTFTIAACSIGDKIGVKNINSARELKAYLDSQPENNSEKPIKVSMNVSEQSINEIAAVIMSTDKYVSLNLSGSHLRTIPDYAFYNIGEEIGCEKLISITLPKSVSTIGEKAFLGCTNLKITIPKNVTRSGNKVYLIEKKGIIFGNATVSRDTMTVNSSRAVYTLTRNGNGSSSNPFIGTWTGNNLTMTYKDTTWRAEISHESIPGEVSLESKSGKYNSLPAGTWTVRSREQ